MHTNNPLTGFGPQTANVQTSETRVLTSSFVPFLNTTVLRLMNWFYQGSTKTLAALQSLVDNVILHPDFHLSDLKNFSASRKSQWLEKLNSVPDSDLPYLKNGDWKESLVKVPLPLAQT